MKRASFFLFLGILLGWSGLPLPTFFSAQRHPASDPDEINQQIFAQLLSDKIRGVELITAGPAKNLASRFGHVFIRFVADPELWTGDVVVGFTVLLEENEKLNYWKAVTGAYPAKIEIHHFREFWERYVVNEGRGLSRQILLSTPEQRINLVRQIQDYLQNPKELLGDYTFLRNNCSGLVAKLFKSAGFPFVEGLDGATPLLLDNYFRKIGILVYPEIPLKTRAPIQKHFLEVTKKNPKVSINEIQDFFSEEEVHELIEFKVLKDRYHLSLAENFPYTDSSIRFDEVLGHRHFSDESYSYCETLGCASNVLEEFKGLKMRDLEIPELRRPRTGPRGTSKFVNVPIQWQGIAALNAKHRDLLKSVLKQSK